MMAPALARLLLRALLLAVCIVAPAARADTPVELFQSFAGYVNFTGTEATMRTGSSVCDVLKANKAINKTLSGIPAGATVKAARLYWAGSSSTPDYQVTFDGKTINAERKFTSATNGYNYFGGVADVTAIVKAKGNGSYSFKDLTITNGSPYCAVEGVLGGFALLVIYERTGEPFRVLNIYEGFQYIRYNSLTLALSNFKTPDPLGSATGRVGHITWEGDLSLNQDGENLTFNGYTMTDSLNSAGNQFNSRSNIDGDQYSYGIDFDAYTVGSPKIQAGQTSASTVYSSGQDLVLLTAEIVAVPNIPTADLAVSLARSGDPGPDQLMTYTVGLKNNGLYAEPGPVSVRVDLPGMTSLTGFAPPAGWSCMLGAGLSDFAGCTYDGALANGAAAPNLVFTVKVIGSASQYQATASITGASGQAFDNVPANNTATDTVLDNSLVGAGYAFTDKQCTAGTTIGAAGSNCNRFVGPLTAGTAQALYITILDPATGKTKAVTSNTTKNLLLSMSCVNPAQASTVRATFGSYTIPTCLSSGGEGTSSQVGISVAFAANAASSTASYAFTYKDVGSIKLLLFDTAASTPAARTTFVSRPAKLVLGAQRGGVAYQPGGVGLVAAGDPFDLLISALDSTGAITPNFGKESPALTIQPDYTPKHGVGDLTLDPAGLAPSGTAGIMKVAARFSEAGDVGITPALAGGYLGAPLPAGAVTELVIGRFYPAYFTTQATSNFACLANMGCPAGTNAAGEDLAVAGATYSGQPFGVAVQAFNAAGALLKNYSAAIGHTITLKPYSTVGQAGTQITSGGALTAASIAPTAAGWPNLTPVFAFPTGYSNGSPRNIADWYAPKTVYLRAEATVPVVPAGTNVTVTSLRPAGTRSQEDGVQVVSGRLQVGNASGSELLKLPMPLAAQYWTGPVLKTWENTTTDSSTQVNTAGAVYSSTLTTAYPATVTLNTGVGRLELKPPAAGAKGSVDVWLNNPAWLPSTKGRATFGVYRSRMIYIRELF